MFGALFVKSPLLVLPLLSLALFLAVFIGVIVTVWIRGAAAYRAIEALPLADEKGEDDVRDPA
ncbi:MAG: hypothetical protein ACHREM_25045 [Polyangiales bacterium]